MTNRPPAHLPIGELATRTGCSVPTIRYYEAIGLIPPATRRPSGHRVYDVTAQELLTFIRRCRDFGFPIDQIRVLVSLTRSADRDCVEARDLAQQHLHAVQAKREELQVLERSLIRFVEECTSACAGGPAPECSILKDLGSPAPANRCCG